MCLSMGTLGGYLFLKILYDFGLRAVGFVYVTPLIFFTGLELTWAIEGKAM